MLKTYATVLLNEPHKVNGTLTWELVRRHYTFDILPLIRVLAACPNLVVKLSGLTKILANPINLLHSPDTNTELIATVKDSIDTLLDFRGSDDWRDHVLSSASALNFTVKGKECWDPAEWNIVVKLEAMEDWMDN